MTTKIVVLGGSSAFTPSLIDAIDDAGLTGYGREIMLYGRNVEHLQLVERYASRLLTTQGWIVSSCRDLEHALENASIVLNQIRFGGMERRMQCERFCARSGVAADETLGPGALLSGLLSVSELRSICTAIRRYCGKAWVLNLTNPLSAMTAVMTQTGIQNCVGLCELPWVTVQEAARVCEVPASAIEWAYQGLNHRGFVYQLTHQGKDLIPELCGRLQNRSLLGIQAETIADLHAIPLKYFRLLIELDGGEFGRAEALARLSERIWTELGANINASPPSLRHRYLEWYSQSVVPLLSCLLSGGHGVHVLNLASEDGLVREVKTHVSKGIIEVLPQPVSNERVAAWLKIFERHERAFVSALQHPNKERVFSALSTDPTLPEQHIVPIGNALWQKLERNAENYQFESRV
jgi:6-phospho-beta-glucosidase